MQEVAARMAAPGAVWAVAWGPPEARQVRTGAAGGLDEDAILRLSSLTKLIGTAATLALAADGVLSLEDPLDRWVPEWADRRVLRERHAGLGDTVAATRPLTVRDLLLMGFGLGYDLTADEDDELHRASEQGQVLSSWVCPESDQQTWVARTARLPLRHQPGAGWLYQTSFDALTVVLEAATGQPVEDVLHDVILGPLGMSATSYSVAGQDLPRVPALWFPTDDGQLHRAAPEADPALLRAPTFASLSTGLVSTVADQITFAQLLLDGGVTSGRRLLPRASVEEMGRPALGGPAQEMAGEFLDPGRAWGLGAAVDADGRFGWDGGTGTSLWIDPAAGTAAVLLTRQGMGGPSAPEHLTRFWSAVRAGA